MKKNLHPERVECTVTCDCGASFKTVSTKKEIHVEVCNNCHPFYTGTQGSFKKAGNVEKFNKKYNLNKENK